MNVKCIKKQKVISNNLINYLKILLMIIDLWILKTLKKI